jgi:hypothetical protein
MNNIINNINLNQYQILNAILHKVGSINDVLSPIEGQIAYVDAPGSVKGFYYRTDTDWFKVPISSDVVTLLTSSNSSVTFSITVDSNGFKNIDIAIAEATSLISGFLSTADKNKLSGATSFPIPVTLVERDGDGLIQTETALADKDAANKKYVDDAISEISSGGALSPPTVYNLVNNENYSFPSESTTGKTYILANSHANGTTLGIANPIKVNNGDLLICTIASGIASVTNGADWFVVESNRDKASDVIVGVTKLIKSSIGVGDTLTSNNGEAISPSALINFTRKYTTSITTDSSTEYVIVHEMNKNLEELIVVFKDNEGNELNVFKEPVSITSFKIILREPVVETQTYYITVTG